MTTTTERRGPAAHLRTWLDRWGPILPLLGAEFMVLVGFGAVLPVLPLYLVEHGVDIATLGLVVAAWPAARLVGEPIFGWVADRTNRKPLMVAGLVLSALFVIGPLAVSGALAFIGMRALAGAASALYDPAARGYLMDATPPDRRGEAFGLFSAAQNAGFIFGPALGGLAVVITGDVRSVFFVGGIGILVAALVVVVAVRERPHPRRPGAEAPVPVAPDSATPGSGVPSSLWNRMLIAAIALNFGNYFAGGVWEVIWSLYMVARGGDLTWIGITFALFGLPILVISPFAGRLVDRRGPLLFITLGTVIAIVTSLLYVVVRDLPTIAVIVLAEGVGWALVAPALFSIVGKGTPAGRSSTAQGIFGASGTLAFIVASVVAGQLFALSLEAPFILIAVMVALTFLLALAIGGRIGLTRLTLRSTPSGSAEPA